MNLPSSSKLEPSPLQQVADGLIRTAKSDANLLTVDRRPEKEQQLRPVERSYIKSC